MTLLREVNDSDLPFFFTHQQDPVAKRMAVFPGRDWEAFLSHWQLKVLGEKSTQKKTIVIDGHVIGYVSSWNQDGRRLVGYWIDRAHWGKGITTAALAAYLACEPVRPLCAYVAVSNVSSIRVLEKCGFCRVGESTRGEDEVEEWLFQLDA